MDNKTSNFKKFLLTGALVLSIATLSTVAVLAEENIETNDVSKQPKFRAEMFKNNNRMNFRNDMKVPATKFRAEMRNTKGFEMNKMLFENDEMKEAVQNVFIEGIDESVVEELKENGYDNGRIALMVGLAEKADKSVDEVVKLFEDNKVVFKVYEELGLKFDDYLEIKKDINARVSEVKREFEYNMHEDLLEDLDSQVVEYLKDKDYDTHKIMLINELAQKTEKSVEEVVELFEENDKYGELYDELGLEKEEIREIHKEISDKIKESHKTYATEKLQQAIDELDSELVEKLREKDYSDQKILFAVKLSELSSKTIDEVVEVLEEQNGLRNIADALEIEYKDLMGENAKAIGKKNILKKSYNKFNNNRNNNFLRFRR